MMSRVLGILMMGVPFAAALPALPPSDGLRRVTVHGAVPPPFAAPEPIERPGSIESNGRGAWPGSWTAIKTKPWEEPIPRDHQ